MKPGEGESVDNSVDDQDIAQAPDTTGAGHPPDENVPLDTVAERPAETDKTVFGVAAALALVIVAWGVLAPENLAAVADTLLNDAVIPYGGWIFVLVATGFVLFAVIIAISRYGRIPLGADKEKPEFRTVSWIAMMFSAGMGIGLMFFGVAEPLSHLMNPPPGTVAPGSDEAVHSAMAITLFHWTVHPWAIYAVVGLAIAYSTFRMGRSQLLSSVFAPLFGKKKSEGPLGKAIDIMAIFATLFGSAASLGLGALQVGGGLGAVGWIDNPGTGLLVIIIAILTIAFIASAVSGVAKGIQWLSNINMVLAGILALFIFVVGPTVLILNLVPGAIGDFVRQMPEMAGRSGVTGGADMQSWLSGWTVFYWAWWISWTPFVGMFIARISRGRTIRQFIVGVIAVPSIVSLVWFAIFGGAAISKQQDAIANLPPGALEGADSDARQAAQEAAYNADTWVYNPTGKTEEMMFSFLEHLPWMGIAAVLVMLLVSIFFVSGADAASVVMGTLSQRGSVHPKRSVVIFWGVLMGAVAAVMLMVGGEDGLTGLQNLTILISVPFVVVMVLLCVSVWRDLRNDPLIRREDEMMMSLEAMHEERATARRKKIVGKGRRA